MMTNNEILAKMLRDSVRDDGWNGLIATANAVIEALEAEAEDQDLIKTERRLKAALARNRRVEQKAAAANNEVTKLRQENSRLKFENKIQHGWLNAEDNYTRRYNALEARVNMIRDVLSDTFPERYGEPGAYNWFGTKP